MNQRSFTRDPLTWLAYGLLAYLSYYISALGPIVPFLRAELALDYTISGLHLTVFALGVGCVSLISDRLARRWARRTLLWGGGALAALCSVALVAAPSVWITLPSFFGIGLGGGVVLIMVQATLADHHGEQRARALTEANVLASLSGTFAPLLIGLNWRGGVLLAVLVFAVFFALMRRVPVLDRPQVIDDRAAGGRLPRRFWLYWLVMFLCVAIEWCIMFWAASFLATTVGLSDATAAASVSVFLLAMLLGRAAGSVLTDRLAAPRLLMISLGVIVVGFPVFWLAPAAPIKLIGLFITGCGVANLYPLSLSLAMATAPQQANRASARATLASSGAMLSLPFALGTLADQIGIGRAFGVVIVLVGAALVMLLIARRRTAAPHDTPSAAPIKPTAS